MFGGQFRAVRCHVDILVATCDIACRIYGGIATPHEQVDGNAAARVGLHTNVAQAKMLRVRASPRCNQNALGETTSVPPVVSQWSWTPEDDCSMR